MNDVLQVAISVWVGLATLLIVGLLFEAVKRPKRGPVGPAGPTGPMGLGVMGLTGKCECAKPDFDFGPRYVGGLREDKYGIWGPPTRIEELEDENARLRAQIDNLQEENFRLKRTKRYYESKLDGGETE